MMPISSEAFRFPETRAGGGQFRGSTGGSFSVTVLRRAGARERETDTGGEPNAWPADGKVRQKIVRPYKKSNDKMLIPQLNT